MAYDNIIKYPQGNTALIAGAEVTFEHTLRYRHHAHLYNFTALRDGDNAVLTDVADIVDTIEYQLNSRTFRFPMTPAQIRWAQNTFEKENYAGNRPGVLIVNFREWQNQLGGDQDVHSIAMGGGVVSFTTIIKFKAGIHAINMDNSRVLCDDGVVVQANGTPAIIPLIATRTYEKFSVQNSFAGEFVLPQFSLRDGAIKRITFEDGGKIDRVEVLHGKRVVYHLPREVMKMWMLDLCGLDDADAATATRFTLPIDFLNRGLSGLGMKNGDGSRTDLEFRIVTNTAGGFPGIIERVENPLNAAA